MLSSFFYHQARASVVDGRLSRGRRVVHASDLHEVRVRRRLPLPRRHARGSRARGRVVRGPLARRPGRFAPAGLLLRCPGVDRRVVNVYRRADL